MTCPQDRSTTARWYCILVLWATASVVAAGCGTSAPVDQITTEPEAPTSITLRSTAFEDGGAIPSKYTCDGENNAPPLSWSGVPEAATSLVVIVEDPDAPSGTFTHWVVYDLPASTTELPEGVPPEAGDAFQQGVNDFKKPGYGGPCPPSGTHHYVFQVFALDAPLDLPPGASRQAVLKAMHNRVLARGRLIGTYQRKPE